MTLLLLKSVIKLYYLKEVRTTLYKKMLAESQRLEQKISSIQAQIGSFPEGKLICTRNEKRYKWYQSENGKYNYIPKAQRDLAEKLAAKQYLTLLVKDLQQEKRAIDNYLRHHNSSVSKRFLNEKSEYQKLLSTYFQANLNEYQIWANSIYKRNQKHPEQLTFKTLSGHMVRSKSEVMIDNLLYTNKIPFHYEESLILNSKELFPDFTVRHPKTGKTYFWEHFGLMDNPIYRQNVCEKLQLYTSNGIIPSIQLITTYETKEKPLSTEMIEKIVEYYFL